jgi:hypothetical protein
MCPDHPISVERNASRLAVTVAGRIVADATNAFRAEQQYKRLFNRREIYCHNSVSPSHYLVALEAKQRGYRDDSIKAFQFRDEVRSMQ